LPTSANFAGMQAIASFCLTTVKLVLASGGCTSDMFLAMPSMNC
jgi:hypothetical protein